MTYDLDKNEKLDSMKINGVEYAIGDIPVKIMERIMNIETWFFKRSITKSWLPICEDILKIRNENVNISNITDNKLLAFINYINDKILKWQVS